MNIAKFENHCTFCKKDVKNNAHVLHATTGIIVSNQIDEIRRVDPVTINQKITTQYTETQDHTYTLCNDCWTIARVRLMLLLSSPVILWILFLFGRFAINIQLFTADESVFIVFFLNVLLWVIGIPYARSHEPWHRLKKMAIKERGGAPYVVFSGSKENSTWILPV